MEYYWSLPSVWWRRYAPNYPNDSYVIITLKKEKTEKEVVKEKS